MNSEQRNITLAEEELSNYEKEILIEKSKFKALDKLNQHQYVHETACMFDFLQDVALKIYTKEDDGLIPTDDTAFGLKLVFDCVGKRIWTLEAIADETFKNT